MNLLLGILFGLCALASAIVLLVWTPLISKDMGRKFNLVAMGMLTATTGVLVLSLNRVSVAFFGERLDKPVLFGAGLLILVGKSIWVYGATMGKKSNILLWAYALTALLWVLFCVMFYPFT